MHLKEKNPTNYSFNLNLKNLKESINNTFGNRQYRGMHLYAATDKGFWNKEIFSPPENKNDFYLTSFEFIGKSAMYYSWWGRLTMSAEFHIHLDSISENITNVKVYTFNEEVVTGFRPGLGDNWTFVKMCSKPVAPSTVEEYEILMLIGKAIGEKNMPQLKKPKLL